MIKQNSAMCDMRLSHLLTVHNLPQTAVFHTKTLFAKVNRKSIDCQPNVRQSIRTSGPVQSTASIHPLQLDSCMRDCIWTVLTHTSGLWLDSGTVHQQSTVDDSRGRFPGVGDGQGDGQGYIGGEMGHIPGVGGWVGGWGQGGWMGGYWIGADGLSGWVGVGQMLSDRYDMGMGAQRKKSGSRNGYFRGGGISGWRAIKEIHSQSQQ